MKPVCRQFLLVVLCVMWIPTPLFAQKTSAQYEFKQGTELFEQKKFSQSAERFREAYKLKPTWRLLFNIGQAEAAAKQYGLALESFERYLSEGGDEIEQSRRNDLLQEIREIRQMVGDLTISGPDGAVVIVDGVERVALPLLSTIAVSAGTEHHIVVKQNGRIVFEEDIRVRSTKKIEITVRNDSSRQTTISEESLTPHHRSEETDTDADSDDDAANASPWHRLKVFSIISTAVGGAVVVGGVATGAAALSKKNELDNLCSDGMCIGKNAAMAEDSRKALALTTDILMISGGVIATTGVVLLILSAKKKRESLAQIAPIFDKDFAGMIVKGEF